MRINSLHQIEITSRCNLRCHYCPSPKMKRPHEDMSLEVYEKCLDWASYFVKRGTQRELNLCGTGESTLHPEFSEWMDKARKSVGNSCRIVITTNGITIAKDPSLVEPLARNNIHTYISLHRPEKAGKAVEITKKAGILAGVSADAALNAIDWAGQVDWHVSTDAKGGACMWLTNGFLFCMSNGNVTRCCIDSEGTGVMGSIFDPINEWETKPFGLCKPCHFDPNQKIPLREVYQ